MNTSFGKQCFFCDNPKGIQLLTRSKFGLSHLREHQFKNNFQDTHNLVCIYGEDIETSCHCFLHCLPYTNESLTFLNVIWVIDNSILELVDSQIV